MFSPERCPACNSPRPDLHPAMQHEGEVEVCGDPWHLQITPENPLKEGDAAFLARFAPRGWLAASREDADEEAICRRAVRAGYLRRYRSEYLFTSAGKTALASETTHTRGRVNE